MTELNIPEIYWDDESAVRLLAEYFTRRRSSGDLFYSGAHFERLGGGGDAEHVADRFDTNDLVAITMLSVSLEPHRAINLLADPDGHWARLLSLIPRDARLEDAGSDALIAEGGPAGELWERLADRKHPNKPDGSGPVIAGKLLARKRPHLIPIYDIRVKQLFQRPKNDHSFWASLAGFPDRAFAFDEFGPLGIRPTAGSCWAEQGRPERHPATYHRTHGVRYFHGCYSIGDDTLWGVNRRKKGAANTLTALKSIRAAHPDGAPIYPVRPQRRRYPSVGRRRTRSTCASLRPTRPGRTRSRPTSDRCGSSPSPTPTTATTPPRRGPCTPT